MSSGNTELGRGTRDIEMSPSARCLKFGIESF